VALLEAESNTTNKYKTLSFYQGDLLVTFSRALKSRVKGKILIKIDRDLRVIASAPKYVSNRDVIESVRKRLDWIQEQLQKFSKLDPLQIPKQFCNGELHPYLGIDYPINIIETSPNKILLTENTLEIHSKNTDANKIKSLMNVWYKAEAKKLFDARVNHLLSKTDWVTKKPSISTRTMKSRWGSCSTSGSIRLNSQLIKTPLICIDYVILHELCHIAEMNHSQCFYRLLDQVMPEWREVKRELDRLGHGIL
jgi:predicted metal-dependent hydrolase